MRKRRSPQPQCSRIITRQSSKARSSRMTQAKVTRALWTAMGVASEASGKSYSSSIREKTELNLDRKACRRIFPGGHHSESKCGEGHQTMDRLQAADFCPVEMSHFLNHGLPLKHSPHPINCTQLHTLTRDVGMFINKVQMIFALRGYCHHSWK